MNKKKTELMFGRTAAMMEKSVHKEQARKTLTKHIIDSGKTDPYEIAKVCLEWFEQTIQKVRQMEEMASSILGNQDE